MPDTTTASSVFSNRRAAVRAAERLAEGGFARNSIDVRRLHHDDEAHEVSVRVRQANIQRAEDLLNASTEVHEFGSHSSFQLPAALLVGGAILAVGALAYTLMQRDDLRRRFA
jgi:hypothetical protein